MKNSGDLHFCFLLIRKLSVIIIILGFNSCQTDLDKPPIALFEYVDKTQSQVDFINQIKESPKLNVLTYEYFYNGAGVAVADFNQDNLPDLYFISNLDNNTLYLNKGNFNFSDITTSSNVSASRGFKTGVSIVDINFDGRLDIYVCKSGRFANPDLRRNELFINQGNNAEGIPTFKEAARDYGLDIPSYSTQATFFDYDKDGDLDMFLINHGIDTYEIKDIPKLQQESDELTGERLYKNENGFFIDVTNQSGIINNKLGFGLGVAVGDLNNDTYPDLYVSNDYSGKDHLYINQKNGTFQEQIKALTNQISFYAMGNDIGDINNDGWADIINLDMVAAENYGIKTSMSAMNPQQFEDLVEQGEHYQYMFNSLLLNNGIAQKGQQPLFSNIAQLAGISNTDWSWAPLLFDMDNDGWQDLFVTNGIKRNIRNNDALKVVKSLHQQMIASKHPQEKSRLMQQILQLFPYHQKTNYFFRNLSTLKFKDITQEIGFDSLISVSSGAAYADLDLDGDLDLVVNNADQPAFLIKNNAQKITGNYALRVKFKGTAKNPFGIGAKVIIESKNGIQSKELYTSRGYKSSVAPIIHFGLGAQSKVEKLKVVWADGKIQKLENIKHGTITLDYKDAVHKADQSSSPVPLFVPTNAPVEALKHQENAFNDFLREGLLPHRMSNMGPCSSVGDVNNDGIPDLFIGAAKGHAASLFIRKIDGTIRKENIELWESEKKYEDVASCLFDADSDGDLDLVVGSGSNEWEKNDEAYRLRFYENSGKGIFKINKDALPKVLSSTGVIKSSDFDKDGDLDLFVGGRQSPGNYPQSCSSFILKNESENGNIRFHDATEKVAPYLKNYGMVTDAIWADFNGDQQPDLVTVGEWMFPKILINNGSILEPSSELTTLDEETGWWYSVAVADFDQDGDLDIVAGNLGLNYKYKATKENPFEIFTNDFDENGSQDIVLSYYEDEELIPLRGRECSSNQLPFIKEKFKSYDAFARATVKDIFSKEQLESSTHFIANNFAHCYFENKGNLNFIKKELPIVTQVSSINAILIHDLNNDGNLDILCAGNLYGSEVETPRNDASFGHVLLGNGNGEFEILPASKSGFQVKGEIRDLILLSDKPNQKEQILVVKNNRRMELFNLRD